MVNTMKKQVYKLQENVFTTIAKALALPLLKSNMNKLKKQFDDDPSLQSTIASIEYHTNELERQLKNFCKMYPESKRCKDKKGSK